MSTVVIARCNGYSEPDIVKALTESINLLGGIDKFVHPGETIFLKPNLAGPFAPEKAITTHPIIIRGIIQLLKPLGVKIILGDSPAGIHKGAYLKAVYKSTGMEEIVNSTLGKDGNLRLCYDTTVQDVRYESAKLMKNFNLVKPVLDCAGIINVPKMKTHLFTTITGAVKNLYGTIPGVMKVAYHSRYQDPVLFTQMLIDLYQYLHPRVRLNIVDGIVAMEGNGPTWGKPKPTNLLIIGDEAVAVDWTLSKLMGLKFDQIPFFKMITVTPPQIKGIPLSSAIIHNFKPPAANTVTDGLLTIKFIPQFLRNKFGYHLTPRPQIITELCKGCEVCINTCPQKTIKLVDGKAVINSSNCIRCWCCNEVCPYGAVKLTHTKLGKILGGKLFS